MQFSELKSCLQVDLRIGWVHMWFGAPVSRRELCLVLSLCVGDSSLMTLQPGRPVAVSVPLRDPALSVLHLQLRTGKS